MNKAEFLSEIQKGLSGLPPKDVKERLAFFSEMIDDRIEDGLSEEEAVDEIGPCEKVISQIIADTPLPKIVREKVRSQRSLKAWEIVLLILGSPIWLSLLIAAIAVVFSVYVVIWSLVISLWAIEVALAASSVGVLVFSLATALQSKVLVGLTLLGAALVCLGLSVFLFFGCKAGTNALLKLTRKIALGIKSLFVGREEKQ